MSQMIGINLEGQNQFIVNNVITTQNANIPSKEQYEKMLAKTAKKEGKVKSNQDMVRGKGGKLRAGDRSKNRARK